jgi:hypothetical protein
MAPTWSIVAVGILIGFAALVTLIVLWLMYAPAKPRGFEVQVKDPTSVPPDQGA